MRHVVEAMDVVEAVGQRQTAAAATRTVGQFAGSTYFGSTLH